MRILRGGDNRSDAKGGDPERPKVIAGKKVRQVVGSRVTVKTAEKRCKLRRPRRSKGTVSGVSCINFDADACGKGRTCHDPPTVQELVA